MKRVLITGIAGFIGFHLSRALKKRGDFVCGCDHFNAYYTPQLKRERARILQEEGISCLEYDIIDKNQLMHQIQKEGITHLVHLAAQAGVRYATVNPDSYVHSNLNGFLQVLEALKETPGIPFIYASSSSVYGLNTKVPFSETDPVEKPASFYGATKRSNELIAHAYHHLYGLHTTGLRFFTVYGPWGRPDMAYYAFTQAILEGRPITLFEGGELQRDFTYIDDIIRGTLSAIDLRAPCELFNLGNHHPVRVLDLITTLETSLNKKAILTFSPKPPGDVAVTYADITKSQRLLGFAPSTSLETGLSHFVHWYKEYHAEANCNLL